eukprot:TRINITY_DN1243_c0_g1_i3.p1 TRINITY_DN1243_c0_g1~~TRINITY_DN1243_c0_g1_i3.p1  ORF type:complete len:1067 (-),score=282.03 TRINITY_DN1243_c0_g1_i3:991-4191(-)
MSEGSSLPARFGASCRTLLDVSKHLLVIAKNLVELIRAPQSNDSLMGVIKQANEVSGRLDQALRRMHMELKQARKSSNNKKLFFQEQMFTSSSRTVQSSVVNLIRISKTSLSQTFTRNSVYMDVDPLAQQASLDKQMQESCRSLTSAIKTMMAASETIKRILTDAESVMQPPTSLELSIQDVLSCVDRIVATAKSTLNSTEGTSTIPTIDPDDASKQFVETAKVTFDYAVKVINVAKVLAFTEHEQQLKSGVFQLLSVAKRFHESAVAAKTGPARDDMADRTKMMIDMERLKNSLEESFWWFNTVVIEKLEAKKAAMEAAKKQNQTQLTTKPPMPPTPKPSSVPSPSVAELAARFTSPSSSSPPSSPSVLLREAQHAPLSPSTAKAAGKVGSSSSFVVSSRTMPKPSTHTARPSASSIFMGSSEAPARSPTTSPTQTTTGRVPTTITFRGFNPTLPTPTPTTVKPPAGTAANLIEAFSNKSASVSKSSSLRLPSRPAASSPDTHAQARATLESLFADPKPAQPPPPTPPAKQSPPHILHSELPDIQLPFYKPEASASPEDAQVSHSPSTNEDKSGMDMLTDALTDTLSSVLADLGGSAVPVPAPAPRPRTPPPPSHQAHAVENDDAADSGLRQRVHQRIERKSMAPAFMSEVEELSRKSMASSRGNRSASLYDNSFLGTPTASPTVTISVAEATQPPLVMYEGDMITQINIFLAQIQHMIRAMLHVEYAMRLSELSELIDNLKDSAIVSIWNDLRQPQPELDDVVLESIAEMGSRLQNIVSVTFDQYEGLRQINDFRGIPVHGPIVLQESGSLLSSIKTMMIAACILVLQQFSKEAVLAPEVVKLYIGHNKEPPYEEKAPFDYLGSPGMERTESRFKGGPFEVPFRRLSHNILLEYGRLKGGILEETGFVSSVMEMENGKNLNHVIVDEFLNEVYDATELYIETQRKIFQNKIQRVAALPTNKGKFVFAKFGGQVALVQRAEGYLSLLKPWMREWITVQVPSIVQREVFARNVDLLKQTLVTSKSQMVGSYQELLEAQIPEPLLHFSDLLKEVQEEYDLIFAIFEL